MRWIDTQDAGKQSSKTCNFVHCRKYNHDACNVTNILGMYLTGRWWGRRWWRQAEMMTRELECEDRCSVNEDQTFAPLLIRTIGELELCRNFANKYPYLQFSQECLKTHECNLLTDSKWLTGALMSWIFYGHFWKAREHISKHLFSLILHRE